MKIPSIKLLPLPLYLAIHRAAAMPIKKVITVVARTVLHDTHKGAAYDSAI
jgi:hypothetical protein